MIAVQREECEIRLKERMKKNVYVSGCGWTDRSMDVCRSAFSLTLANDRVCNTS